MEKRELLKNTMELIEKLPQEKIKQIKDFADFLLKRIEDETLVSGIQKLTMEGSTYDFLEKEEDIYTVNDLKEKYK